MLFRSDHPLASLYLFKSIVETSLFIDHQPTTLLLTDGRQLSLSLSADHLTLLLTHNFKFLKRIGWGTWIRTKTNRVRAGCSAVELSPSSINDYDFLLPLFFSRDSSTVPPIRSIYSASTVSFRITLRQ